MERLDFDKWLWDTFEAHVKYIWNPEPDTPGRKYISNVSQIYLKRISIIPARHPVPPLDALLKPECGPSARSQGREGLPLNGCPDTEIPNGAERT